MKHNELIMPMEDIHQVPPSRETIMVDLKIYALCISLGHDVFHQVITLREG